MISSGTAALERVAPPECSRRRFGGEGKSPVRTQEATDLTKHRLKIGEEMQHPAGQDMFECLPSHKAREHPGDVLFQISNNGLSPASRQHLRIGVKTEYLHSRFGKWLRGQSRADTDGCEEQNPQSGRDRGDGHEPFFKAREPVKTLFELGHGGLRKPLASFIDAIDVSNKGLP